MYVMNRLQFLNKILRFILFGVLAVMAAIAGSRVTITGSGCSTCPGKGICNGKSDCELYLTDHHGREAK